MSRQHRLLPVVLGVLAAFGPLSIDMYLPALPSIQSDLHTTPSAAQLSLAAYFAGLGISQLFYGVLADRLGRKRPLVAGIVLYMAASLACAFAPNIGVLIAMRFLQAMGGAAGPVVSRAIVRDLYRGNDAARLMSLIMLVMGIAPILAPLVGGAILGWVGWRAIFVLLGALGVGSLTMTIALLPETGTAPTAPLEPGVLGRQFLSVLKDGRFLTYTLAGGFAMAGMFAYISGSPFVIIELHHVPASRFGWFFGANAFGLIAGSQINHRLLGRYSSAQLLARAVIGMSIAAVVLVVHGLTGVGGLPLLAVGLFVFVSSLGFINPNAAALAMEEHGSRAGIASAVLGSLQFLIAAASSASVGAFEDGTARPMTCVMAACALLAGGTLVIGRSAEKSRA